MQQLLGDRHAAFDQSLLHLLFLQSVPPHIRMILAANAELALLTTADLADHLIDAVTPTEANVTPPHTAHRTATICNGGLQEARPRVPCCAMPVVPIFVFPL